MKSRNQCVIKATSSDDAIIEVNAAINEEEEWIRLDTTNLSISEANHLVNEIASICKRHQIILTLVDDVDLVIKTKVHGVHLNRLDIAEINEIRQRLGANAIIGVEAESIDQMQLLSRLDVDYMSVNSVDYLVE